MTIIERAIRQSEQEHGQEKPRLTLVPRSSLPQQGGGAAPLHEAPHTGTVWALSGILIGMVCGAVLFAALARQTFREAFEHRPVAAPAQQENAQHGQDSGAAPVRQDANASPAPSVAHVPPTPAAQRSPLPAPGGEAPRNAATRWLPSPQPDAFRLTEPVPAPIANERALSASALNNAALLYLEQGNLGQARAFLEEVLRRIPDDEKALNNLGLICYREGDYEAALRYYERALAKRSANLETLVNLGVAQHALGRYAPAQRSFERAITLDAGYPEALYNYALLLEDMRQEALARRYFEQFLRVAPERLRGAADNVRRHLGIDG